MEYPKKYKYSFIKSCFDALNGKAGKTLPQSKKFNERAKHRCVALCIESRPDTIAKNKNSISELLDFGCTRVELGVQCLDDRIYKKISRHHAVKEVIEATKILKENGFKIGYHIMLGLPGSNPKKDLQMFKKLFSDEKFKPDQLKIYPCQVIKGAKLVELYKKGRYKPYPEKEIKELTIKIMHLIPNYCRVMRIMREIPPDYLVAGTTRIDLRKDIEKEIKKRKLSRKINEIRFREIGFALRNKLKKEKLNKNLKLKVTKYKSSGADEYFLEIINKNNLLFGLCRLRINKKEIAKAKIPAVIRELHVYGQSLPIGTRGKRRDIMQHKGLGRQLLKKAEEISRKSCAEKLYVISGVGAREYYRKFGYILKNSYMTKSVQGIS